MEGTQSVRWQGKGAWRESGEGAARDAGHRNECGQPGEKEAKTCARSMALSFKVEVEG